MMPINIREEYLKTEGYWNNTDLFCKRCNLSGKHKRAQDFYFLWMSIICLSSYFSKDSQVLG